MVRFVFILSILMFAITLGATQASAGAGDGHSLVWFRDADGDGIPNGLDDDWFRPEDGTGYRIKNRFGMFGVGTFLGDGEGGKQNRHRKNRSESPGDCLRIRLQKRDGNCK